METRVVTAHLPEELAKKLDGLAEQLERPRAWVVKEAVAAYIRAEDERNQQTLAAFSEVDAENVVEHADVEAWATKLRPKGSTRKKSL